jgi:hypothetical protein
MSYRKTIETLDVHTQDLLSAVEHLLNAVCLSGQTTSLEHILAWRVGHDLIGAGEEQDDADCVLAGYLLTLDVLCQHPEVMPAAAEALYAKVAAIAPRLEVSTRHE